MMAQIGELIALYLRRIWNNQERAFINYNWPLIFDYYFYVCDWYTNDENID